MSPTDRIRQLLRDRPGLKAQQIADELGLDRPQVAAALHYKALHAAGLHPVPQYEEAPYTLDFALIEGERKLDIEVDGENYHRNWDGEVCRRDQIRSRRLSDLGWDVMRFWVYELRDDLEGAVARVKAWMNRPVSH